MNLPSLDTDRCRAICMSITPLYSGLLFLFFFFKADERDPELPTGVGEARELGSQDTWGPEQRWGLGRGRGVRPACWGPTDARCAGRGPSGAQTLFLGSELETRLS